MARDNNIVSRTHPAGLPKPSLAEEGHVDDATTLQSKLYGTRGDLHNKLYGTIGDLHNKLYGTRGDLHNKQYVTRGDLHSTLYGTRGDLQRNLNFIAASLLVSQCSQRRPAQIMILIIRRRRII